MSRPLALVAVFGVAACWPALPPNAVGFECGNNSDCGEGLCIQAVCRARAGADGGMDAGTDGGNDAGMVLDSLVPPVRVAFHRLFYPEGWGAVGSPMTVDVASAGRYDSTDTAVVQQQVDAMEYGRIRAGIVFWDGPDSGTDVRFSMLLDASSNRAMKWAVYYEPEQVTDPSPAAIGLLLDAVKTRYAFRPNYFRIAGRPVVFVRFGSVDLCASAARWSQGNDGGVYVVLKVFSGYQNCTSQPQGWHQYAPDNATGQHGSYSAYVSPGFQTVGAAPRLVRDVARFTTNVQDLSATGATFQCVETFNDFVEGTAVESAPAWASDSGYGQYLDVLHAN